MSEFELPEGQYLSISRQIHPGTGGQTKALLMRNRMFSQHSNIDPVLLALDDDPNYPKMREMLYDGGDLLPGMPLFNIFEWYRDTTVDHLPATGDALPDLEGLDGTCALHPDGTIYKTVYTKHVGGELAVIDYHRADGSVFLRVPAGLPGTTSPITDVHLANSAGAPVGQWASQRGWRRQWVLNFLEPDRRAFLLCDSRFAIADIMPMRDERLHIIHVVHNVHVRSPYTWSSPVSTTYRPLFTFISQLDALVTLTRRQSEDLAARFGATDNLFVVANPVERPPPLDPPPVRDPKNFVILARLETQKRLEDAIQAFALVVKEEPAATLDIYGDGILHAFLAGEIENHGVGESVRLRGYDTQARAALWSASGMLMTSRFEGYPLASLEAMSQGCPVISYDVKYGLREQITSGVDGFLVEAGDVQGMADRVLSMIRDPELTARMSRAAFENAGHHDYRSVLEEWRSILERVIENRENRTTIKSVELSVTRLGFEKAPSVEFSAKLMLDGRSSKANLDDVVITLEAVEGKVGSIISLPLVVQRVNKQFMLSATIDPTEIFADEGERPAASVRLRLRLVWHNSSWQTWLAPLRGSDPAGHAVLDEPFERAEQAGDVIS